MAGYQRRFGSVGSTRAGDGVHARPGWVESHHMDRRPDSEPGAHIRAERAHRRRVLAHRQPGPTGLNIRQLSHGAVWTKDHDRRRQLPDRPGPADQGGARLPLTIRPPKTPPNAATDGWLHFQSDNRDFIGGGVQKVWTLKESDLSIGGSNHNIVASVSGQGDWWYLNFRGPSNGDLHTATYTNAERAPFVTGKAPGLDVNGDGRGCNTLSGRFQIKSLVWTTAGTVAEMDVLFEQHCEGGTPALRGELWVTTELGVHKAAPSASSAVTF